MSCIAFCSAVRLVQLQQFLGDPRGSRERARRLNNKFSSPVPGTKSVGFQSKGVAQGGRNMFSQVLQPTFIQVKRGPCLGIIQLCNKPSLKSVTGPGLFLPHPTRLLQATCFL